MSVEYALLGLVQVDGFTYAVLAPASGLDQDDELEPLVYSWIEDGDEVDLEPIGDTTLIRRVLDLAEDALLGEEIGDDEPDD